jgi:hypothetical protein
MKARGRFFFSCPASQCWRGFAGKMRTLLIKSALEQKKRKFAVRGLQQE